MTTICISSSAHLSIARHIRRPQSPTLRGPRASWAVSVCDLGRGSDAAWKGQGSGTNGSLAELLFSLPYATRPDTFSCSCHLFKVGMEEIFKRVGGGEP